MKFKYGRPNSQVGTSRLQHLGGPTFICCSLPGLEGAIGHFGLHFLRY